MLYTMRVPIRTGEGGDSVSQSTAAKPDYPSSVPEPTQIETQAHIHTSSAMLTVVLPTLGGRTFFLKHNAFSQFYSFP